MDESFMDEIDFSDGDRAAKQLRHAIMKDSQTIELPDNLFQALTTPMDKISPASLKRLEEFLDGAGLPDLQYWRQEFEYSGEEGSMSVGNLIAMIF